MRSRRGCRSSTVTRWADRYSALRPGGIVLPDIQQIVLTNLKYFHLRVPSCTALDRYVPSSIVLPICSVAKTVKGGHPPEDPQKKLLKHPRSSKCYVILFRSLKMKREALIHRLAPATSRLLRRCPRGQAHTMNCATVDKLVNRS